MSYLGYPKRRFSNCLVRNLFLGLFRGVYQRVWRITNRREKQCSSGI